MEESRYRMLTAFRESIEVRAPNANPRMPVTLSLRGLFPMQMTIADALSATSLLILAVEHIEPGTVGTDAINFAIARAHDEPPSI